MAFLRLVFPVVLLCLVQIWHSEAGAVKEYDNWDDFKAELASTDISIVDFFASWCHFCTTFAPKFEEAAGTIQSGNLKDKVQLVKIQCDSEVGKPICAANGIQGYPTIHVYKKGKKFDDYKGARTPEAVVTYANEVVETGKPKFQGKQGDEKLVCLAKDYLKYVSHKSRKN